MAGKTVTFESKYSHHQLVRKPKVQIPLPDGTGWQTTGKGVSYSFQPTPSKAAENGWIGVLTVREGQDKLVDSEDWLAPGSEVGPERDVVEALMAHREFGRDFWLSGHGPGTLYPRPVDMRRDMKIAVGSLNEEQLVDMLNEERRTHQRADLIEELEDSLAIVRELLAAAAAEAQAEQPKTTTKTKAAA